MPSNVCDISTSLKEWSDNKVFSIKMGLILSHCILLRIQKMSANYVSLTLIAKGMIEIEIVLPSLAFNVDYNMHMCPMFHYFNTNTVQVKKGGS